MWYNIITLFLKGVLHMFDGIRYFCAMLEVHPLVAMTILAWPCLECYSRMFRLVAKIKETKDENGNKEYKIYRKID